MSESLRTSRSLLEEAAKVLKSELTAGQKKLPPALQKAIKDKEDKKDEEMDPKKDMVNKTKKGMEEMMPKKDMMKKKDEELSDKQKKMDMNKNGKIDGEDLAKLRAKKVSEELKIMQMLAGRLNKEELEVLKSELETKLEE
tara:strand:- start:76 stop:498 length:423 start_codon:yes stop_codon:yes gene_type:complete